MSDPRKSLCNQYSGLPRRHPPRLRSRQKASRNVSAVGKLIASGKAVIASVAKQSSEGVMRVSNQIRWRLWFDIAMQAWYSLGNRRFRTMLSVSGIAFGVATIILVDIITYGGRQKVYAELQTFGLRSVWISRNHMIADPHKEQRTGTGIDNGDFEALRNSSCCKSITLMSPIVFTADGPGNTARVGRRYSKVQAEGVNEDYIAIANDHIVEGRAFTAADIKRARPVAIINSQMRDELFDKKTSPIGHELRLDNRSFEIIGLLAPKDRSLLTSFASNFSGKQVLIPYTRAQAILSSNQINTLRAQVREGVSATAAAQSVANYLRLRQRNAYSYEIQAMEQYMQAADNILDSVAIVGTITAAVSLFIAGIGILNIMSTAVMERTREIGVRKALGGSEREILVQFLFEAALISLFGGIAGLLLGIFASVSIALIAGIPLEPSMLFNGFSLLLAVAAGLVSGLYPAYRAAHLQPVEALRYE